MIHKLIVCNFKSYKGTIEVDFGTNKFSAIIGPNGVGKSNLMDAISFVFGSSLLDLRTRTYRDLVWRDPQEDTQEEHHGNLQNNEAYVEAQFDDLVIRRTLGDTSEHFINGEEVEHDDYMEKLESLGISKHNNSLVFQGSIEKFANLTPRQLSDLFEEISGSDQYRAEYDQLAAEAAEKRQISADAGRARSKQLSLVKRLDATQETHKERDRMEKRIKKLGIRELAMRAALLDCRMAEAERNAKRLKREQKLAAETSKESLSEVAAVKSQLVKAIRQIQGYEDEARAAQLASKRATVGLLNSQSQLESCAQRLDDLGPQLSTGKKEFELFSAELASTRSKIDTTERGFARLLDQIPVYDGDMDLYHKCSQEFDCETSLEQSELDRFRRKTVALESDLNTLAEQQQALETRHSQVQHHHDIAGIKVQESNSKLSRFAEHEERLESDREGVQTELNALRQEISLQESQLRERAQNLKGMQSDKRRSDQRNSLLERVQKLKRNIEGVVGVLYTLMRPKDDDFAVAIDLILGANFNAVLVDSVSTAHKCIEFCQANNLGTMTFLPLDSLKSKPIGSKLREISGARLAVDAISYDREYASAVAYVCGDALICDSSDLAYSIHQQFPHTKIVAVDGTVLHSNNIVTAGGAQINRFDRSRAATLRAQVTDLVEKLKSNKLNENSLAQQLFVIEERLEELRAKREQLVEDNATEKTTLEAFTSDLEQCDVQKRELGSREVELREELDQCEESMRALKKGFAALKKRVFAPFIATTSVDIDTFQEAREKRSNLQADLERQQARLQEELEYVLVKYKSSQARVDSLEEQYNKLRKLHSEAAPLIEAHRDTLAKAKTKLLETQEKISEGEMRVETLNSELVDLQGQEFDKDDKTDEIKQQIKEFEEAVRRADEQRRLIEDCDEDMAMDIAEDLMTSEKVQVELDKVQTEIRKFASERENLIISHDLDDIDLETAEETLHTLSEAFAGAQRDVNHSERALDKVRRERTNAFELVLSQVQGSVTEIYKELTTTKIDPMGGTATLRPLNETEPFLGGLKFSAMPPRKPFTDISSLSGGEKTIAALALIFALNKIRSSPIYVLDEVDAALDYANVHLVAKYIAKCAQNGSQFLVISLKLWFFEHANNLLGVYRKRNIPGSKLIAYELGADDDDADPSVEIAVDAQ